ncbi:MAG: DUF1801 domain-containing protein [Sphaerobacteraceae bacterium]|nr:MAG: DUF1801 domain-containing protein [Sphaerobacteraceae bacterium]
MSDVQTPDDYVSSLDPTRRELVGAIRSAVRDSIQDGFEEIIDFGMMSWVVPLERFPDTYNGHPTMYISLASQKNYVSLYMMAIYADAELAEWFQAEYAKLGHKPDMGKSCVRFKKLENVPLDLIREAAGMFSVDGYLAALHHHQNEAKAQRVKR